MQNFVEITDENFRFIAAYCIREQIEIAVIMVIIWILRCLNIVKWNNVRKLQHYWDIKQNDTAVILKDNHGFTTGAFDNYLF